MTEEQEVIKYIEKRIKVCNENANICDDNDFDEEATYLREESYILETVLNMLKEKDKKIEKKDRQIKLMAQTILENTSELKTFWCNGCTQIANCPYKEAVNCIEDFFERKSRE